MAKIKIDGFSAHGNGGAGIYIDGQDIEISLKNGDFGANGGPNIDVRRAKKVDIEECSFRPDNPAPPKDGKKSGKYFGGFSFSKGDHLDGK